MQAQVESARIRGGEGDELGPRGVVSHRFGSALNQSQVDAAHNGRVPACRIYQGAAGEFDAGVCGVGQGTGCCCCSAYWGEPEVRQHLRDIVDCGEVRLGGGGCRCAWCVCGG